MQKSRQNSDVPTGQYEEVIIPLLLIGPLAD